MRSGPSRNARAEETCDDNDRANEFTADLLQNARVIFGCVALELKRMC